MRIREILMGRAYRDLAQEGFIGLGIETPKLGKNEGLIFRTANIMGNVDFLFTIGEPYYPDRCDTSESWRTRPIHRYDSFKDLYRRKPLGCDIIGVEQDKRSINLPDFKWPTRTILLFGNETNGLSPEARKSCRQLIQIPSELNISLNVSAACSMVLYDHLIKTKFQRNINGRC